MLEKNNKTRIVLHSFGCKVNQYETELIRQMFLKTGGFVEAADPEEADLCLVNTCTVTAKNCASAIVTY